MVFLLSFPPITYGVTRAVDVHFARDHSFGHGMNRGQRVSRVTAKIEADVLQITKYCRSAHPFSSMGPECHPHCIGKPKSWAEHARDCLFFFRTVFVRQNS